MSNGCRNNSVIFRCRQRHEWSNQGIADTNALTVVKLVQATAGDISLSTEGTLTLNSGGTPSNVVSTLGTGTITLDANGVTSDIDVEDGISSASGTISLTADNDIDVQDGLSSTSGDISLTADNDILLECCRCGYKHNKWQCKSNGGCG